MKPGIIVHGGAGNWSASVHDEQHKALRLSVSSGWDILDAGGSALDAVEKAVNVLEDAPYFEAGIGSALNEDGIVEMDALIIDGSQYNFGAISGVKSVRYPVSLARKIMTDTDRCFFAGSGTDRIARKLGFPVFPNSELITPYQLKKFHERQPDLTPDTVGAVAIDRDGNIAAGTSTSGMRHKPQGRVGDSPLFGAGGYANKIGGASATGVGENIMRVLLSKYAVDQVQAGLNARDAAIATANYIAELFDDSNAGIIIIDEQGNVGAAHTTPKMAIAWMQDGQIQSSLSGGIR